MLQVEYETIYPRKTQGVDKSNKAPERLGPPSEDTKCCRTRNSKLFVPHKLLSTCTTNSDYLELLPPGGPECLQARNQMHTLLAPPRHNQKSRAPLTTSEILAQALQCQGKICIFLILLVTILYKIYLVTDNHPITYSYKFLYTSLMSLLSM